MARLMLRANDRQGWRYAILTLLALFPATLVFLATRNGPGISPDSVVYSSTARAFASTGDLTNFFGKPLTIFPPGFPMLLGYAERLGLDQQTATIALNLLCVAMCVVFTYALAAQLLQSHSLALLAVALVSLCVATVRVFSMMWTEPLFALLCLVVLNLLARALRRHQLPWWELVGLWATVSFACTLRFVGLTLIPVAVAGVLLALWEHSHRRAVSIALLTLVLSSLGFVLVAIRNASLGVPYLGERNASGISPISVLHDSITTIGGYVLPESALPASAKFVLLILGLLFIATLVYATYLAISQTAIALILTAVFIGLYWIAIGYSEIAATLDPVNERFSAPVFAPMVVLALFALRGFAHELQTLQERTAPNPKRKTSLQVLAVIVAVALGVCVSVSVDQSTVFIRRANLHGLGFNESSSLNSPLSTAVSALAPSAVVATTNPWRVYWNTHRSPLRMIPVNDRMHTSTAEESFITAVQHGEVQYLAYFNDDPTALSAQALQGHGIALTPVGTDSDGALYRVTSVEQSQQP